MWPSQWCQKSTSFGRGIFIDIRRGISEEEYQTSYHVEKLKSGNSLEKLQITLTETRQI